MTCVVAAGLASLANASSGNLVLTRSTTLTEDHQGSIIVAASGITIDCAGHAITGPGFAGVDIEHVSGVTIENCNVSGFKVGFFLVSAPGNTLRHNTASNNEGEGFALATSSGNDANALVGNTAAGNGWWGFAVYDNTKETKLQGNTSRGNGFAGFFVGLGSNRTTVVGNVSESDTFNGFDIDSDANVVAGNAATASLGNGFLIYQASGNLFTENVASRNALAGFVVGGAETNNTLLRNRAVANGTEGFNFNGGTSADTLRGNSATLNGSAGFGFYGVSAIDSSHDTAMRNGHAGFGFSNATSSTFTHDVANGNENGFQVDAAHGIVFAKDVANANGGFGFLLADSTGNVVRQSVAHANPYADARDDGAAGANTWLGNSFGLTFLP